jgi:threonine/homoserine/homoserine lactone efflux protein
LIVSLTTGIVLGLSAGFAPGPLLALVVSQTLEHDVKEGVKVALAPLVTDLPIILLALFLSTKLSGFRAGLGVVSVCGGLFVSYLAYENLRTHRPDVDLRETESRALRRGVLANFLSPHPYLFWLGVGVPIIAGAWEESGFAAAAFVGGFYLCLVGSKVILALIVGRSRGFLTGRTYAYAMRVLGALMLLFASMLFVDGAELLGLLDP